MLEHVVRQRHFRVHILAERQEKEPHIRPHHATLREKVRQRRQARDPESGCRRASQHAHDHEHTRRAADGDQRVENGVLAQTSAIPEIVGEDNHSREHGRVLFRDHGRAEQGDRRQRARKFHGAVPAIDKHSEPRVEKHYAQGFRAAGHVCDRFRLRRMHQEECAGKHGQHIAPAAFHFGPAEQPRRQEGHDHRRQKVEDHVGQMVAEGVRSAALVIEPKAEHQQWTHAGDPRRQRLSFNSGRHERESAIVQYERAAQSWPVNFHHQEQRRESDGPGPPGPRFGRRPELPGLGANLGQPLGFFHARIPC